MKCNNCGISSPDNAVECEFCGTPFISGKPKMTLIKKVGGALIEIPENGGIIGRGYNIAPEVFGHMEVSELHCEISNEGNIFLIEDIGSGGNGSTNGTFLNGEKLLPRKKFTLNNGDVLGISESLWFDVKIEYPQKDCSAEAADTPVEKLIWVIKCPRTGTEYEVADSNARITECTCCDRDRDKKRIAEEKPQQVRRV